jgi:hypothetical protein
LGAGNFPVAPYDIGRNLFDGATIGVDGVMGNGVAALPVSLDPSDALQGVWA